MARVLLGKGLAMMDLERPATASNRLDMLWNAKNSKGMVRQRNCNGGLGVAKE